MNSPRLPLQKWLQRAGVGSKREVRAAIAAGRVTLDGEVIHRFAENVSEGVSVLLDGQRIVPVLSRTVLLMNKPKKHVTAVEDRFGRPALGGYLPDGAP